MLALLKPTVIRLALLKAVVIRLLSKHKAKQSQIFSALLKPPGANLEQITDPQKALLYNCHSGNWLKQIISSSFLESQHFEVHCLREEITHENNNNIPFKSHVLFTKLLLVHDLSCQLR